ncbi:hypothetical protein [Ileibacterium valens]|uniref:hypothetical protein n=1 Tax=Ileibacterium valens TaxID=1862668 RepID=UPI00272AF72E|nr:hypothetical protein [Ileibacterium valens]
MERLRIEQLKSEFVLQTRLYNRLKKWLSNTMILSSLSLSLMLFMKNQTVCCCIASFMMVISISAMLIIGLAVKRGKTNLDKLTTLIDEAL